MFTQKCQWLACDLVLGELTFHLLLKCQFSSPIHLNQSLLDLLCIPIHSTNQSTPIWLKPNARCLDQSLPNLPCIPIISINQRTPLWLRPNAHSVNPHQSSKHDLFNIQPRNPYKLSRIPIIYRTLTKLPMSLWWPNKTSHSNMSRPR